MGRIGNVLVVDSASMVDAAGNTISQFQNKCDALHVRKVKNSM